MKRAYVAVTATVGLFVLDQGERADLDEHEEPDRGGDGDVCSLHTHTAGAGRLVVVMSQR